MLPLPHVLRYTASDLQRLPMHVREPLVSEAKSPRPQQRAYHAEHRGVPPRDRVPAVRTLQSWSHCCHCPARFGMPPVACTAAQACPDFSVSRQPASIAATGMACQAPGHTSYDRVLAFRTPQSWFEDLNVVLFHPSKSVGSASTETPSAPRMVWRPRLRHPGSCQLACQAEHRTHTDALPSGAAGRHPHARVMLDAAVASMWMCSTGPCWGCSSASSPASLSPCGVRNPRRHAKALL